MKLSRTRFEQFLNIEAAGGGVFYNKENAIAFIYDSPGTLQVFKQLLIKEKCMWPERLTFHEDRCTDPRILPDDTIIFCKDRGGNENYQIHAILPDGKEVILSTDKNAKHMPGFVGKLHFYFSANMEDKTRFDIFRFEIPIKTNSEFELIQKTEPGVIVIPRSESPSGKRLASVFAKSNMDSDIYIYDFKFKESENVSKNVKGSKLARFYPWEFLDEDRLIVTSDLDREFMNLGILNVSANRITWLEEDHWDTTNVLYHRETDQLVYVKNEDGITKIYLVKEFSKKNDFSPVELPLPDMGNILAGDYRSWTKSICFSHDGSQLLFSFSSGKLNPNLWLLNVKEKTLEKVTFAGTAGLSEKDFVSAELHHFESFDGLKIPYFLYVPQDQQNKPVPCILMIHGGPEAQITPSFNKIIQFFVSEGYAVATPNIRGSAGYGKTYLSLDDKEKRMDSIRDIRELARHLKQNEPRIDGKRLAIYGGSYGGFAVLASITEYPDLWKAAVDIVGISNFVTFLKNTAPWRRRFREAEYGSLENDYEVLVSISPIHKVDRIKTPLLIIQGDNDERVPLSEAIQIYEKLSERNVPVELLRFHDEGHGIAKRKNQIVAYRKIIDFLDKYVKEE